MRHPFAADRPIESKDADLLGRSNFSTRIGEALSKWREKDSLVLAIYGRWGEGKSSVKNMALEFIRAQPEKKRLPIVEFNPWEWADQQQLMGVFFREIYVALGKVDDSKEAKARTETDKNFKAVFPGLGLIAINLFTGNNATGIRFYPA